MKIYKVNLEPLDWFFFGGEKTFDNSVRQSYIAHSNKFPQQTALLGMIRYQLLKQKGLLFEKNKVSDLESVSDLIGNDSFMMGVPNQSFGAIERLSPVFLEKKMLQSKEEIGYLSAPLTRNCKISFDNQAKVYINGQIKCMLINDNNTFEPKPYDSSSYIDKNGKTLNENDIFVKRMQIGITKNTDSDSANAKDDGFYKREMIKFKSDGKQNFYYSFYVSIDNSKIELVSDYDYVFLGAERSCFKMTVKDLQIDEPSKLPHLFVKNLFAGDKSLDGKILLLSHTYVKDIDKLNSICNFHWSSQIPFRNITRTSDGNLNSGDVAYIRKDACYQMLCAGSVLYFDEKDRAEVENLLNDNHMQKIGYNYYK